MIRKVSLAVFAAVFAVAIIALHPFKQDAYSSTGTNPKADTLKWQQMNHKQRKEFMHDVVMPRMSKEFRKFDSVKYANFKCITCHGDGAKDDSFKMPNPKLLKLPKTPEGFSKLREKHEAMLKFMMTTVKPTMASLLNEKPFDMRTKTGFGCGNCHLDE